MECRCPGDACGSGPAAGFNFRRSLIVSIIIRQEEPQDFEAVFGLIRQAFEGEEHSDHREQFLAERLRNSDALVPELSLVAETGGHPCGTHLVDKGENRFGLR